MQPLQYDLRNFAAKNHSITHAAKARSKLDAATTMRFAKTELQTAIPFILRERLQSKMEFHRQLIRQQHLQSHLHCENNPTIINHNGILSATHPPTSLAIPFTLRERSHLQCGTDPPLIRPYTRPSRNRLTVHTSHFALHTSHFTLHISHFSLLTASFTLQTSHFTLLTSHFTLHTSHSTLHSPHFSLLTASFPLQTSHFSLRTSHSTLHSHFTLHTSHCALRTPN